MTTTLAVTPCDVLSAPLRRATASQRPTQCDNTLSQRLTVLDRLPVAVPVPGIARSIEVKIASNRQEWEEAFQLVDANYRARGYELASTKPLRFTPHHALPSTTTFVAKHASHVVATLTLVVDNTLLGLPMECIYGSEIHTLRNAGAHLGEVTSLADTGLSVREFMQVFISIIKLMVHYHTTHGGDTCVISVNPRHCNFYSKVIGFTPLGGRRSYPCVEGAPAEAYVIDLPRMRGNAPKMYEAIVSEQPAPALLTPRPIPAHLARYFGSNSTQTTPGGVKEILEYVANYGSPRRW